MRITHRQGKSLPATLHSEFKSVLHVKPLTGPLKVKALWSFRTCHGVNMLCGSQQSQQNMIGLIHRTVDTSSPEASILNAWQISCTSSNRICSSSLEPWHNQGCCPLRKIPKEELLISQRLGTITCEEHIKRLNWPTQGISQTLYTSLVWNATIKYLAWIML